MLAEDSYVQVVHTPIFRPSLHLRSSLATAEEGSAEHGVVPRAAGLQIITISKLIMIITVVIIVCIIISSSSSRSSSSSSSSRSSSSYHCVRFLLEAWLQ